MPYPRYNRIIHVNLFTYSFITLLVCISFGIFMYPLYFQFQMEGLKWDSAWYSSIISNGYMFDGDYSRPQNVAFMPLSPALDNFVNILFNTGIYSIYITNYILILISSLLSYILLINDFSKRVALLFVIFMLFNPFSIYFYNGYSEPKFLFLFLLATYFMRKERWLYASIAGGISFLVRPYGVFLILPLLIYYLYTVYFNNNVNIHRNVVSENLKNGLFYLIIFFTPFTLFTISSYLNYGDPMLQLNIVQEAWGAADIYEERLTSVFNSALYANAIDINKLVGMKSINVASLFLLVMCGSYLMAIKQLKILYLLVMLPAITVVFVYKIDIINLGRYVSVLFFPGYLALAILFEITVLQKNLLPKFIGLIGAFVLFLVLLRVNYAFAINYLNGDWVS